jgi:hypothetical protein
MPNVRVAYVARLFGCLVALGRRADQGEAAQVLTALSARTITTVRLPSSVVPDLRGEFRLSLRHDAHHCSRQCC